VANNLLFSITRTPIIHQSSRPAGAGDRRLRLLTADQRASEPPDPSSPQHRAGFSAARERSRRRLPASVDLADHVLKQTSNAAWCTSSEHLALFALSGTTRRVLVYASDGRTGLELATMAGLYPDVDTYTNQIRALEAYAKSTPTSASAQFLLGYIPDSGQDVRGPVRGVLRSCQRSALSIVREGRRSAANSRLPSPPRKRPGPAAGAVAAQPVEAPGPRRRRSARAPHLTASARQHGGPGRRNRPLTSPSPEARKDGQFRVGGRHQGDRSNDQRPRWVQGQRLALLQPRAALVGKVTQQSGQLSSLGRRGDKAAGSPSPR